MLMEKILILSALAFSTTYFLTPWSRKISTKWGMVDCPGERKIHKEVIPYGGGIAIFLGFLAAFLFLNRFDPQIFGIITGAFLMVMLGIVDDILGLKALPKFLVQSLAAFILIYFGVQINMQEIFRGQLAQLAFLSIPLTYLWVVGITNAINIIDGLDGLAAGVATISAFTIAAVAFTNGQVTFAVMALILGFASLGFLPHNFHSKIFMGDSGSMFLGFMLAALSLSASVKLAAAFSLFVPLMILAIPVFDVAFAILRRLIAGKPIYVGDDKHLHHRLLQMGFSPLETVIIIYVLSLFCGGLAFYSTTVPAKTGFVIFGVSLLTMLLLAIFITIKHQKKTKK